MENEQQNQVKTGGLLGAVVTIVLMVVLMLGLYLLDRHYNFLQPAITKLINY